MDVTLQRHFAKFIYVIPDGLRELSSDITREVLRTQPKDLYTFIADYLDALMVTRENARVAAKLVADILQISETTAEMLYQSGVSREKADQAAHLIQRNFKKYLDKKDSDVFEPELTEEEMVAKILEECKLDANQANMAASLIQKCFRNFKEKRDREDALLAGVIDWRVAARSAVALYRKAGVTYEEANRAATLIKAAYKGYYTRKVLKRLVRETKEEVSEECLCQTYSLQMPAQEPGLVLGSQECICSLDSVELIPEPESDVCLCQYSSSEQLEIGKGVNYEICEELFSPLVEDTSAPCLCDQQSLLEPVVEEEIKVRYVAPLTEDDEEIIPEEELQIDLE